MYKHIMLPYDGSPLSDKALRHGIDLAKSVGSKITLIYVVAPHHLLVGGGYAVPGLKRLEQEYQEELTRKARDMLQSAQRHASDAGVACNVHIEDGENPHEHIVDAARQLNCDLILMASHGRRGIEGLVIGSETVKVLTHSQTPVLVVR